MANAEFKSLLRSEKIFYWELADALGVCENTIVRKLRKELSEQDKAEFSRAIERIKAKRKTA